MSLHFNQSRDGRPRATIRTRHRIGRDTLETAAAAHGSLHAAGKDFDADAQAFYDNLTRPSLEHAARQLVTDYGNNYEWAVPEDTDTAHYRAAADVVARLFPEITKENEQ